MIYSLKQVHILDVSEGIAGPYAATLLADMGAQVIKLERPDGDWGRSLGDRGEEDELASGFAALNRNKRAIALDLKREEGRLAAESLVQRSDVVLSNFRPGVMERLGLGYEDCKRMRPGVIYCDISAFGNEGEYSGKPGSDTALQAISGLMSVIGEPEGSPLRVGFPLIDIAAALFAVQGILKSLLERRGEEASQRVEISLFDSALALQTLPFSNFLIHGKVPSRSGNDNPVLSPAGTFLTADDRYLTVTVLREAHWEKFCKALGREDLLARSEFSSNARRVQNRSALNEVLRSVFAGRSLGCWLDRLQASDVLCAPVNDYRAILGDGGLISRATIVDVGRGDDYMPSVGNPVRYEDHTSEARFPAPAMGEHTEQLLRELLFEEERIESLVREGIALTARIPEAGSSKSTAGE